MKQNLEEVTPLKDALQTVHKSDNEAVKGFMSDIGRCETLKDILTIMNKVSDYVQHENGVMTMEEYNSLYSIAINLISRGDLEGTTKNDTMVNVFKNRIWHTSNILEVIQFRNCVTDMLALSFMNMEEYIELNNEIDKFVQYAMENGISSKPFK